MEKEEIGKTGKIKKWVNKTEPIWRLFVPNAITLFLVYAFLMLFLANQKINAFINKHIGDYLSSLYDFISSNKIANWASFLLVICTGIVLSFRETKRKSYSWLLIFSVFVIAYIFVSNGWLWATSPIGLDYNWLIASVFVSFIVIEVCKIVSLIKAVPLKVQISSDKGFSVTTEQKSMQDTGWKPYVENLVSKLLKSDLSKESFAVGVSGVWGSGKTTFLNAIEQELSKKVYLLKFNPWNGDTAQQISGDFFDTLISGLSISSNQKKTINRYSKLLGQIGEFKSQVELLKSIYDNFSPSIADAKSDAEKVIAAVPRPVVVIIDDLDRLEGAELMAVLKLIRITANFKNLIFIVAYDKGYIANALKGVGGDEFLKKIIPLEICLPEYETYIREFQLYNELKSGLANDFIIKEIEDDIFRGAGSYKIPFFLPTFRDVKRFANLFCLDINTFVRTNALSEINVSDFFFVELLHYYDNDAYNFLKTRPSVLIQRGSNNNHKPVYSYLNPKTIQEDKKLDETDKLKIKTLNKYKDGFRGILWVLFGSKAIEADNLIRYPVNFSKYFSFRVNNDSIGLNEFNAFLNLTDSNQIDNRINDYCRGTISKHNALYNHLISQTLDPNDKTRSYNVIYSLIELWKYYHFSIEDIGKSLFDKKVNATTGIIPEAFKEAVQKQINKTPSKTAVGIQELLRGLVRHDFIDQCDENGGYIDYESVISLDVLMELSEMNFVAILGDRIIPIQDITDKKSSFNRFLRIAVAKVGFEYYGEKDTAEYKKSLLVDKLKELYSRGDNRSGLEIFFKNLDPRTEDEYYEYPEEIFNEDVTSNIESVFGNDCSFKDFYEFVQIAFADNLKEVNVWLNRLKRKPIEIEENSSTEKGTDSVQQAALANSIEVRVDKKDEKE